MSYLSKMTRMGLRKLSQETSVGQRTAAANLKWQPSALQESSPVSTWAEWFGQEVNTERVETISSMLFCNQVQLVLLIFCISHHLSLSRPGRTNSFRESSVVIHYWLCFLSPSIERGGDSGFSPLLGRFRRQPVLNIHYTQLSRSYTREKSKL